MKRLYTIGFTKKTAEVFFNLLRENKISVVIDIRLNNTSQLAAFAKYPDINFFLKEICNIEYFHDIRFSPEESTLKKFKKKIINWREYEEEFNSSMVERNIDKYIRENYSDIENICLLCSESVADKCHRGLVANRFKRQFINLEIVHL